MEFSEVIRSRYSVRKFQARPVEQEKLDAILSAVTAAPTACNNQPQKVYVLKSEEAREKLKEVCPCTFDAPLVFIVGYDEDLPAAGRIRPDYRFGETDAAIVTTMMMLTAQAEGLGSCYVGWFCSEEVKEALSLPEKLQVTAILPVGYPAEDAAPADLHGKTRPASEMIFEL